MGCHPTFHSPLTILHSCYFFFSSYFCFMPELPVAPCSGAAPARVKKPDWLRVKLPIGESYKHVRSLVDTHKLHTICESGNCPNMGECWGAGTATFMILGNVCTRSCGFCAVATGRPEAVGGKRWAVGASPAPAFALASVRGGPPPRRSLWCAADFVSPKCRRPHRSALPASRLPLTAQSRANRQPLPDLLRPP